MDLRYQNKYKLYKQKYRNLKKLKKNHLHFQYAGSDAGNDAGNDEERKEAEAQQVQVTVTTVDGTQYPLGELSVNTTISNVKERVTQLCGVSECQQQLSNSNDNRPEDEPRELRNGLTLEWVIDHDTVPSLRSLELIMLVGPPCVNVTVERFDGEEYRLGEIPINTTILNVKQLLSQRCEVSERSQRLYNANDNRPVDEEGFDSELVNGRTLEWVIEHDLGDGRHLKLMMIAAPPPPPVEVSVIDHEGTEHLLGELARSTTIREVKQRVAELCAVGVDAQAIYNANDERPPDVNPLLTDNETLEEVMGYGLGEGDRLELVMVVAALLQDLFIAIPGDGLLEGGMTSDPDQSIGNIQTDIDEFIENQLVEVPRTGIRLSYARANRTVAIPIETTLDTFVEEEAAAQEQMNNLEELNQQHQNDIRLNIIKPQVHVFVYHNEQEYDLGFFYRDNTIRELRQFIQAIENLDPAINRDNIIITQRREGEAHNEPLDNNRFVDFELDDAWTDRDVSKVCEINSRVMARAESREFNLN